MQKGWPSTNTSFSLSILRFVCMYNIPGRRFSKFRKLAIGTPRERLEIKRKYAWNTSAESMRVDCHRRDVFGHLNRLILVEVTFSGSFTGSLSFLRILQKYFSQLSNFAVLLRQFCNFICLIHDWHIFSFFSDRTKFSSI